MKERKAFRQRVADFQNTRFKLAAVATDITAGLLYGASADDTADELREAVRRALERHTELRVESIDVHFDDVFLP